MNIQQIDKSKAAELSGLAKAIYVEHYLHLWYPGGAEWYMNEYAYPEDKLQAELADPNNLHYIVYNDKGLPEGYLKLKLQSVCHVCENKTGLEIERIYLHKAFTGKGIGKQLMELSEAIARQHNQQLIFLKAMDTSLDAIRFYKKMGFTEHGRLVLPFENMKEIYRGMVILCKQL